VQTQILDQYPKSDLSAYVVWLPVLPLDNNRVSVTDTVTDGRATHFWDNDQVVSADLSEAYGKDGAVVWDAVFVFGPDAKWDDKPPPPIESGAPVVTAIEAVKSALKPYLN
jgi:hypothetical protein